MNPIDIIALNLFFVTELGLIRVHFIFLHGGRGYGGRGHGPAPTKTAWFVGAHPCVRPPDSTSAAGVLK